MARSVPTIVPITVKSDPDNLIGAELLEQAILDVANGMKQVNKTRLTRRALVALIKDASGVAKTTIEIVLNNLEQLEETYLKKKEKK